MLIREYTPVEPRAANPNWPLPLDYPTLSDEGRRLARVNACLMQRTPEECAPAWLYFCSQYLWPDAEADFDPCFYHPPIRPFGFVHPLMIQTIMGNRRSAVCMPRGSAKTTTLLSMILWLMHTHRQFRTRLWIASEEKVIDQVRAIRDQFESNSRLLADYGNLVPGRNEGVWSHHKLRTASSSLCTLDVMSIWSKRLRGGRFDLGLADDVEYDPDNLATSDADVERLALRILKIIMPMMEETSHFGFAGTELHCKSLLHRLSASDAEMPDRDPRLRDELWAKIKIPARRVYERSDGTTVVRRAWVKYSDDFLDEQREVLGDAHFGSEFDNNPVSSLELPFRLMPTWHEYHLEGDLTQAQAAPFESDAVLHYNECAGLSKIDVAPHKKLWREHIDQLYRFLTVDYAYTAHAGSDWSVVHVLGVDARNDLWSLDMWRGRVRFPAVVANLWRLATLWRVNTVGMEAYPVQEEYLQQVAVHGARLGEAQGFCPPLLPIKPPIAKGLRVLRLQWRFDRGKIKLPGHRRQHQPYFSLYQQIRQFTEDLGNLAHDDEIDTLSMSCDVLRGQTRATPREHSLLNPLERFAQGDRIDPDSGLPLIYGLPLQQIPGKILREVADLHRLERLEQQMAELRGESSMEAL